MWPKITNILKDPWLHKNPALEFLLIDRKVPLLLLLNNTMDCRGDMLHYTHVTLMLRILTLCITNMNLLLPQVSHYMFLQCVSWAINKLHLNLTGGIKQVVISGIYLALYHCNVALLILFRNIHFILFNVAIINLILY